MPPEPATQAALAAEGRTFDASRRAGEDLIRVSLRALRGEMFGDLYDAISLLWSWRWPVADGRITEALGEHIAFRSGEKRARLAVAYEFSIGDDGPYTGECFWSPAYSSIKRVAAARRKLHAHQPVRVRYRPGDPSVNTLDGGIAKLLRRAHTTSRQTVSASTPSSHPRKK